MQWNQGLDEHYSDARVGDMLRLRVFPGFIGDTIVYHAQVSNVNLDELSVKTNFATVSEAQMWAAASATRLLANAHQSVVEWIHATNERD